MRHLFSTLFALLFTCASSLGADDVVVKDLLPSARQAMHGFMVQCLNPVPDHPELQRAIYGCETLPEARLFEDQWDWGDLTGRAMLAWRYVREMTGDQDFGRDIEEAQRLTLFHALVPETGMSCVIDRSDVETKRYHYQMWDQGRALRAMVDMWQHEPNATAKRDLKKRIDKLIAGMKAVAVRGEDPQYGRYAVYPFDFLDGEKGGDDVWCLRGGQMIEPLVAYWSAAPDDEVREYLEELIAGVLSGHEGDTYDETHRRPFIFGENGSIYGHFHTHASSALGIAQWATILYQRGEMDKAIDLLQWVRRFYDWALSPSNNNAGSTWGWFPENVGMDDNTVREVNEICCTADLIELCVVLAEAAALDPSLNDWEALWDHIERYTFSSILPAQFQVTHEYTKRLEEGRSRRKHESDKGFQDEMAIANKMHGSWIAVAPPDQWGRYDADQVPHMVNFGCCSYSGPRALYACWKATVNDEDRVLSIRLPICHESTKVVQTVTEGPDLVRQQIKILIPRHLMVRVPDWADMGKVEAHTAAGEALVLVQKKRWLDFGILPRDTELVVSYPLVTRETVERVGGSGENMEWCTPDQKRTFTATWRGNRVVDLKPQGKLLPIFPTRYPTEKPASGPSAP